MKYLIKNISKALFVTVGLLFTSCNDEFLNTTPLDEFAATSVWSDLSLVETFVNEAYYRISESFTSGRTLGMIVDEGHYRGNTASVNHNRSLLTADVIPGWTVPTRFRTWNDLYSSIRICNVFFQNLDRIPDNSPHEKALKDRLTGEVHFLRAKFYHHLTKVYGGVPIVDKAYGLGEDYLIPRSSYEDCVEFMVADLDKAAALLPLSHSGSATGRATKGAAMALKARVLLYAASDLYNTTVFPGYSNPELIGYTSGSRAQRWQRARDAAKAVIDLGVYRLYERNPDPVQNYIDYFISRETEEDIFWKFFLVVTPQNIGIVQGPNGYHNWGQNAPLGDLVDDIEMADGTRFNWSNPAHKARPYENRDPRFYANILYDGAVWRPRPPNVAPMDPIGIIQTGRWEVWDEATNSMVIRPGLDTRQGPIEDWNGGYTGYYLRKFLDPKVDSQLEKQEVSFRWMRYAEVLLNYAEACIELGEDEEARKYINMVRARAGMPGVTESGDALKARYRNERRIELMFEDQRYFDVRRWVIGNQAYGKSVSAIRIVYPLLPDKTTSTVPTYTPFQFEAWAWLDKAYFHPILRTEMLRNELLVQNPGY
jgi:starch-binding outer membrane protein, SusD/RagB family